MHVQTGVSGGAVARRAEDVLAMQRVVRKDGTRSLLRWLALRTGARVQLTHANGSAVSGTEARLDREEAEFVHRGLRELFSRRLRSMVVDSESCTLLLLPLQGPREVCMPLLTAVVARPAPADLSLLLADAASVLSLCWQAEHTERKRQRLALAEAHNREAVLHLVMNGHLSAARQVAGVLHPPLPSVIRFYVVECPPSERGHLAVRCREVADGAWIVKCPVHTDHLLVIAPAGAPALEEAFTALADDCLVGASEELPLRETATGYAQAFHALAAARNQPCRHAEFANRPDLALTIGPAAAAWATGVLAPLHAYAARRSQDPDSETLVATAASWLAFSSQATSHLKIHRNTLSARLRLIGELLHLDLDRLADQSLLALAMRAASLPVPAHPQSHPAHGGTGGAHSLDGLLARPAVLAWARRQLHPIRTGPSPDGLDQTLTAYLRHDGRIGPTARALLLSTTATRKRLARIEGLLERSLLRSPSVRHDLWLAHRAVALAEGV
ncbi:helix-turn-helix domain-containing protein [Streptomyces cinnamoneus]|uniref:helix-turn-helix domain-containing protein n=1 Tax=Streptomyces cinnamoneus TaxID=53446 RepID=UPI00342BFBCF